MPLQLATTDFNTSLLRLIDASTGRTVNEVKLNGAPRALTQSAASDLLATVTSAGTFIIHPSTLETIQHFETGNTHAGVYSPSGELLGIGTADGIVTVFYGPELAKTSTAKEHTNAVRAIQFSPSSKLLATGSKDNTVIIWTAPELAKQRVLTGHTDPVYAVLFLTETRLVSGGDDTKIRVWDVEAGSEIHAITEHSSSIMSLVLSPGGRSFASGSNDKSIKMYDVATYECIKTIKCANAVLKLWYSPADADTMLVGMNQSEVVAISVQTGKVTNKYSVHEYPSAVIAFGTCCCCKVISIQLTDLYGRAQGGASVTGCKYLLLSGAVLIFMT